MPLRPHPAPLRFVWIALFAALLGEALLLSPPTRPEQTAWLLRLMTGDWAAEEPLVVTLFQLMGIWPVALGALMATHLRREPVPLWPFAAGSMALGAFSLLPGLALGGSPEEVSWWQRWLGSRWLAGLLLVPALALVIWGLSNGSPAAFAETWRTEKFVHVMFLDFLVLWLTSITLARHTGGPWGLALIPLVGSLIYRVVHPVEGPAA